ncbi:MAG: tail fiber protein [Planctomycetota bacterium]
MFAGNFAPRGWALLDGQLLSIEQNQALFSILGTTYGGDGETTFALPDMRGRTAVHADGTIVDLGESLGLEFVALSEANLPEHDHTYIPEPGSLAVLAIGGLLVTRRRRRG